MPGQESFDESYIPATLTMHKGMHLNLDCSRYCFNKCNLQVVRVSPVLVHLADTLVTATLGHATASPDPGSLAFLQILSIAFVSQCYILHS